MIRRKHSGFEFSTIYGALVGCILAGSPVTSWAQESDRRQGRVLAETVCIACHQIEPGETGPGVNRDAPSFTAVANMASATALSLTVFLRSPHRSMPDIILRPDEISAVVAYILAISRK